jgi:hypothetical protein
MTTPSPGKCSRDQLAVSMRYSDVEGWQGVLDRNAVPDGAVDLVGAKGCVGESTAALKAKMADCEFLVTGFEAAPVVIDVDVDPAVSNARGIVLTTIASGASSSASTRRSCIVAAWARPLWVSPPHVL